MPPTAILSIFLHKPMAGPHCRTGFSGGVVPGRFLGFSLYWSTGKFKKKRLSLLELRTLFRFRLYKRKIGLLIQNDPRRKSKKWPKDVVYVSSRFWLCFSGNRSTCGPWSDSFFIFFPSIPLQATSFFVSPGVTQVLTLFHTLCPFSKSDFCQVDVSFSFFCLKKSQGSERLRPINAQSAEFWELSYEKCRNALFKKMRQLWTFLWFPRLGRGRLKFLFWKLSHLSGA